MAARATGFVGLADVEAVGRVESDRSGFLSWWHTYNTTLTVAGCALGVAFGITLNSAGASETTTTLVAYTGELWLRSIQATIAPMIFTSMIATVNTTNSHSGNAIGKRTIVLYSATTLSAMLEGIVFFLIFRPGSSHCPMDVGNGVTDNAPEVSVVTSLLQLGRDLVPDNMLEAVVSSSLLPTITSGLALGLAVQGLGAGARGRQALLDVVAATNAAILLLISWLVQVAPVGVFSLVAGAVAAAPDVGGAFSCVMSAIGTAMAALAFHVCVPLAGLFYAVTRRNPFTYLFGMSRAFVMAFSTSSSAATLPTTIECIMDQGVQRQVANFVLPLGATVNMDGTAINLPISVLFVANVGGHLARFSWLDYLNVGFTSALMSMGSAPVPSSGLVVFLVVLKAANVPVNGAVPYLLMFEWLLDRCRTTINVVSDAVVCPCVDTDYRRDASSPLPPSRVSSSRLDGQAETAPRNGAACAGEHRPVGSEGLRTRAAELTPLGASRPHAWAEAGHDAAADNGGSPQDGAHNPPGALPR